MTADLFGHRGPVQPEGAAFLVDLAEPAHARPAGPEGRAQPLDAAALLIDGDEQRPLCSRLELAGELRHLRRFVHISREEDDSTYTALHQLQLVFARRQAGNSDENTPGCLFFELVHAGVLACRDAGGKSGCCDHRPCRKQLITRQICCRAGERLVKSSRALRRQRGSA